MPRVTLLFFPGCPHVEAARSQLRAALGADASWDEIDITAADAPAYAIGFGSPTILVDGVDLAPDQPATTGRSCRLYPHEAGTPAGAPPMSWLRARLGL